MNAISLNEIVKTYAGVTALDKISLEVKKGELFGLIGPDGAGKTSLFRILTTVLLPDSGTATVLGYDVIKDYQQVRNRVGYMPGKFSLYQDLTVEENLHFFANLFGTTVKANYHYIQDIYEQLAPFKDRRAGKLSGGMKQKLALCCALIHKPDLLFLDEPTTGVDVVSRKEFWEMLHRLKEQDISILVSTPYMDEAKLCDRIALIQDGKIMQVDTPSQIVDNFPKALYAAKASNIYQVLEILRNHPQVESCFAFGEYVHVTMLQEEHAEKELKGILDQANLHEVEVKRIEANIEDSFIRLMQEQTGELAINKEENGK